MRIAQVLIGLSILSACSQHQQSKTEAANEGSLLIIGGGKRPIEMVRFMMDQSDLSELDSIVLLPWASSEPDSSSFYAKKQFQNLGHNLFWDIQPADLASWSKDMTNRLVNSKLIYIPGGDQRKFMELVEKHDFEPILKKAYESGVLIAGTSAGAAIMSKPMITGTALKFDEYYPTFRTIEKDNLELSEGLGLLPDQIIIDQHFIWRSRHNRLLTALMEFPEWTGWGIEESTAAYVHQDSVEVVGNYQILVFKNESPEVKVRNGYFGATDIKLSIYLPGDKFPIH